MSRAIMLAARPIAVVLAFSGWFVSHAAHAQEGRVRIAVGEVGATQGPVSADALSRALTEALETQDDVSLSSAGRADLVVRGSIVRWERRSVEGALEVRCEVSLVVSEARGGSIRAMLRGRAAARGGIEDRLSQDALRAAVRGALRPLSEQGAMLARAS